MEGLPMGVLLSLGAFVLVMYGLKRWEDSRQDASIRTGEEWKRLRADFIEGRSKSWTISQRRRYDELSDRYPVG
jgi:hypothetical protein